MRKIITMALFVAFTLSAWAQQSKKEIFADPRVSASNYLAYPGPKGTLTPTPKGYEPFYLSHYGRHGSRYLIGTRDYDRPYSTLMHADSLGKLTALGKETLRKVALIRQEADHRDGELTQRGAEQHKQIARRMMERFPEVFKGKTHVDAKSTVVIRCILSMENALQQLLVMNPQLEITHDASRHDMYYMNQSDRELEKLKRDSTARVAYKAFSKRHENYEGVMRKLFNDEGYWRDSINALSLNDGLYKLASNVQSTELRHQLSLYDLFTKEELYDDWLRNNAWWYITYGPSPLNGATQPYSQRNLLRKIISEADSCLLLEHPGATLRYGHDTMVMPLTCLLGINGYDKQIADLEQLDDNDWCDYKIFPMACNLQFVFYRPVGTHAKDEPILVKVLQNEDESHLPIATDTWPYYKWDDFKAHYLKKLDAYEAERAKKTADFSLGIK
jgi:hypothetical protein